MKISSLIRKLEKIKTSKGDIEVCVLGDDFEFGKLKNVSTGYSDRKYTCVYDYDRIKDAESDDTNVQVVYLSL